MAEGLGQITWWGFSPAIDFQNSDVGVMLQKTSFEDIREKDCLNILQIGAGDIRHIIKTIASRKRHKNRKLHFFVCESSLELYVRDILLMTIALESQKRMGLQEKSELFLELYGNIHIREQSFQYVQKMSTELIKMVTDFDYMAEKLPLFDLSQLKFKELDFMEGILKMWRSTKFNIDMSKCWDLRMRNFLKTRYDTRMNAFDWDYSMVLMERGAEIINRREYQLWRNTGVAFEFREGMYDTTNRTLVSARIFKSDGESHGRMGYWGDTVNSPFITLGIESENQSLFKKYNKMYGKTSADISQYNMQAILHELTTGEKYKSPETEKEEKPSTGAELSEITEEEEEVGEVEVPEASVEEDASPQDLPYEAVAVDNVKITFLPLGSVKDHLVAKSKYQGLFDAVYFSNSMVHQLTPQVSKLFADECTVILETAQFMVEIKKEKLEEFISKTTDMAKAAGCQQLTEIESSCFTRFRYNGNKTS